jgi:hypothetical protein
MTKHTCELEERAFGKRVPGCPRCAELASGAPARDGWQKPYFSKKKRDEKARSRAIREHDCKKHGCSVVCVAFDW